MKRLFVMLAAMALIVAACGDDDVFSGSTEPEGTSTSAAVTTAAPTTEAPTTTEAATGNVDKGVKRDPADARSTVLSRQARAGFSSKEIPEAGEPAYGERGSDPLLDLLWNDCAAGDMGACDELYRQSPVGSEYEEFGATCGGTTDGTEWCETVVDVTDPYLYGVYDECHEGDMAACDDLYLQSPAGSHFEWFGYTCGLISDGSVWCVDLIPDETTDELDQLYADCAAGDMQACDDLYLQSSVGSEYEEFGYTCGNRTDGSQWCVNTGLGTTGGGVWGYGDDPYLDGLWDDCRAGDMSACDALYMDSPVGSDYEAFADTCGERTPGGTWCVDEQVEGEAWTYGDDAYLDGLWDDCSAGDMQACDDLYMQSPIGSVYENFADTCGGRTSGGTWCVGSSPDASPCGDATLDALYYDCDAGDMQACDDLYMDSPVGSACEVFADTCGGTTSGGTWCAGSQSGSPCGDAPLDALYYDCDAGDMQACDDLYMDSPVGSVCEDFGDTCGGTTSGGTWCAGSSPGGGGEPYTYGDDAYLDGLWDSCAGGNMQACDDLYMDSPVGSEYESFGDTCGGTTSGGTWCAP